MKKFLAFLLMLTLCITAASAETFSFPAELEVIEAEAFRGVEDIETLVIPSTVTTIGDYAFAECSSLRSAAIPETVTSMGTGVFSGIDLPLLITTTPGSAAMTYALEESIDFNADSTFRALLIGQSNYTNATKLYGPLTDVQIMKTILSRFDGTPFTSTVKTDLTADGIKSSIATAFADAKDQDVSLLFYSGHGASSSGSLCGVDGTYVSAAALRTCLDEIPGRKIIIVDACHSGALIGKSTTFSGEEAFVSAFMTAFARTSRSDSDLAATPYYVITAAHSSQTSEELSDGVRNFGVFTVALAKGCGYDYWNSTDCDLLADTDSDGVISLEEAYAYARVAANTMFAPYGLELTQTAQVWPSNCTTFGFLRK